MAACVQDSTQPARVHTHTQTQTQTHHTTHTHTHALLQRTLTVPAPFHLSGYLIAARHPHRSHACNPCHDAAPRTHGHATTASTASSPARRTCGVSRERGLNHRGHADTGHVVARAAAARDRLTALCRWSSVGRSARASATQYLRTPQRSDPPPPPMRRRRELCAGRSVPQRTRANVTAPALRGAQPHCSRRASGPASPTSATTRATSHEARWRAAQRPYRVHVCDTRERCGDERMEVRHEHRRRALQPARDSTCGIAR